MPQQFIQKTGVDPDTGANYEPVDIMKAINPDTGKLFTGLQEASDVGGYAPVAAPKPTVVGVNNSVNEIDQGADDIEDERTLAQNEIDRLAAEAEATENENNEFGDVSNYGAEFETIQTQRANLGLISTAELAEINAAGEAAGAEFAPLIAQAKERARLGRAKNLVATGRRGGLQRARFVGEEVFPSELGPGGGTGADATLEFEGKGGKLQEMAGAFQRNIDALIIQKNRAINLAKAQARKALRSNKQQDFENTKDILAFARQMNKDIEDAKQQKIENEFKEEQ